MSLNLQAPIPSYLGQELYVFVCYAHADAELVYSDLKKLHQCGINLWYDQGIAAGKSWRGQIAQAIQGSSKLLLFISEASLNSQHCLREIDFALNNDIDIVPVYIADIQLPDELALALNRVQALNRASDPRYEEHILSALRDHVTMKVIRPNNQQRWFRPTVVMALFIAVSLLLWQYFESSDTTRLAVEASFLNASAPYVAGIKLLERWDKDDNLENAVEQFQEAINQKPSFALAHARLAEVYRIQYALSGDKTLLEQAEHSITQAVNLDAELAPVQVALGRVYATQGKMDLSYSALQYALKLDPNDATANAAMGKALERQGRLEEAQFAYNKSLALEPKNLLNLDAYANFLYRQGRFTDAGEHWKDVIKLAPDHFAALTNLGATLAATGQKIESIEMYKRAIDIRPTYMAWSNLGTAYDEARQYKEAIAAFLQAIELNATDWLAWGNLAYSYKSKDGFNGETRETFLHAIHLAEQARQQYPRDPYLNADLGLYYAETQQYQLARERIETATALAPDVAEIKIMAAQVNKMVSEETEP